MRLNKKITVRIYSMKEARKNCLGFEKLYRIKPYFFFYFLIP